MFQAQLALHPPKVREVLESVKHALHAAHNSVIILSGPPGVGKSALLRVLTLHFADEAEVIHYTEETSYGDGFLTLGTATHPEPSPSPLTPPQPKLHHFLTFLRRNNYPVLSLRPLTSLSSASSQSSLRSSASTAIETPRPKLLCVDSLPYVHTTAQRQQLREELQRFLRPQSQEKGLSSVLVCTVTESAVGGHSSALFLFGSDICDNTQHVRLIHLRRITPTRIYRQLSAIVCAEGLASHFTSVTLRRNQPLDPVLHRIALQANGDLRAAIHTLQLYCRRINTTTSQTTTITSFSSSSSSSSAHLRKRTHEQDSSVQSTDHSLDPLHLIGLCDPVYDLFHALGKILYLKGSLLFLYSLFDEK